MKVPEYYMTLLQELSEGTRKPPEGISLSQQEPLPRAIELQQQIQGMGLPEFLRRCAAQDGTELDEDERAALDRRLQALAARLDEQPEARITYFQPDARKAGGAYCTVAGRVKNIDLYTREVVLASGQRIAIDEIVQVV